MLLSNQRARCDRVPGLQRVRVVTGASPASLPLRYRCFEALEVSAYLEGAADVRFKRVWL
jgi:hypothetical protein